MTGDYYGTDMPNNNFSELVLYTFYLKDIVNHTITVCDAEGLLIVITCIVVIILYTYFF